MLLLNEHPHRVLPDRACIKYDCDRTNHSFHKEQSGILKLWTYGSCSFLVFLSQPVEFCFVQRGHLGNLGREYSRTR